MRHQTDAYCAESKTIPKNEKEGFTGSNCRPISILLMLNKIIEKIIFNQMLNYFSRNGLVYAYRPGHTLLTHYTRLING